MWCQPRPVRLRIEALDQRHLFGSLVRQVIPPQLRVVLDRERATFPVRVDEANGDEVFLDVERAPVCDGQRLVCDRMADGTPNVDDADARFQKTFCFVLHVVMHALHACVKRLVDVDSLLIGKLDRLSLTIFKSDTYHWASQIRLSIWLRC